MKPDVGPPHWSRFSLLNSVRHIDTLRPIRPKFRLRGSSMKTRLFAGLLLLAAWAAAPKFRSGVLRRITDSSGALIVGAEISVVNTETNVAASTRSNQDGTYQ